MYISVYFVDSYIHAILIAIKQFLPSHFTALAARNNVQSVIDHVVNSFISPLINNQACSAVYTMQTCDTVILDFSKYNNLRKYS